MHISLERSYLQRALGITGRGISKRNTLPILSHVLLEASEDRVKFTATDLDTMFQTTAPAVVTTQGTIAIPAESLADYVSKLPEAAITIEVIDGKIHIRSGKSKYAMFGSPGEDFPVVPDVSVGTEVTVPMGILKEMLRLTTFAASTEESRSLLMGVLFEARKNYFTLVSTDTHRLAWKQTELSAEVAVPVTSIVPAKPLVELERMLKAKGDSKAKGDEELVKIRFGSSQVRFESSEGVLVSRILDGQFPNYEKVIPKQTERKIAVDRQELLSAVRRIELVSRSASQKMLAEFDGMTVKLSAESNEAGRADEEVFMQMDGTPLKIAFNAKYLSQVLDLLPDKEIRLEMNGSLNPGILRAGDHFLYIVMPMQA